MLVEQGDLILVNFDPSLGHEPQKRRPALVVSVGYFNNVISSLTVVCPITTAVHPHPLHIEVPAGMPVEGRICIEQLRGVDLSNPLRNAEPLGARLDAESMSRVLEAIGAVFGI